MFELYPDLAQKAQIVDLKLCKVLLEDNAFYPWIILVPKVAHAKNMLSLCMEERLQLMREIDLCEEVMSENFSCEQTNVGILGNICPQLCVHIISRKKIDPDWPHPAWNGKSKPYSEEEKKNTMALIKKAILIKQTDPKYMQGMHNPDYSSLEY